MLIPTMMQMARAERSAKLLRSKGAKLFGQGLFVEDDERVRLREPAEVVGRIRALWAVGRVADGQLGVEEAGAEIEAGVLTQAERAFLDDPGKDAEAFAWGKESVVVLLWSLGALERMGWPDQVRPDGDIAAGIVAMEGRTPAIRATVELLDGFDLFLRMLWIVRETVDQGRRPPFPVVPDLVRARVRAFLWITRARELDWDAIAPDGFVVSKRK